MPIISVRDLTRGAAAVFEAMEASPGGPPYVITRNGKPVAALVPIDESQVETLLLAAAPALVHQRDAAANARAEGRTTTLEGFLAAEPSEAAKAEPESAKVRVVGSGLRRLFGEEVAGYVAAAAHDRAVVVTSEAMKGVPDVHLEAGLDEAAVAPITLMNQQLIVLGVQQEMISKIGTQLGAIDAGVTAGHLVSLPEMTGTAQADLVLDAVTARVTALNDRFVKYAGESDVEFLSCYRAELRASVETVASPVRLAGASWGGGLDEGSAEDLPTAGSGRHQG